MIKSFAAIAAIGAVVALTSPACAMPLAPLSALGDGAILKADWICGPGYHIGAGRRRCWPNGRAPLYEIPPGYVVPAPLPAYALNPPPILECPRGYHLGRGLRRCWPN
jgi:hypothetical protein